MDNRIDLHIHSKYSEDGDLTVNEIFLLAKKANMAGISITDHDSVQSVPEGRAYSSEHKIEYIPGVELTTVFSKDKSQQHILGYFINENNSPLLQTLQKIHNFRVKIANKRIENLKKIEFHLDEHKIREMMNGRAPTATSIMFEVLGNKNNFDDKRLKEYFHGNKSDNRLINFYREYFLEGQPAYVPFESIPTEEGINTIIKAGGIPVLAHPKFVKNNEWLDIIKGYGIKGIEAISTYHDDTEIDFYISYARENSLLVTAGSDFHGPTTKPKVMIGGIKGNHYCYFEQLQKAHNSNI